MIKNNNGLGLGMNSGRSVLFFPIIFFLLSGLCEGKEAVQKDEKSSLEERIAIGKQIYRHGTLADGEPVEAYVMGDIKVLGSQFTCLNCHGMSGLGGAEGKTFTLAINPAALFNPRDSMYLERSAYDESTLEVAIRQGETPEGISLTPAMPVYHLPDREMDSLIAYLKTLSGEFSPGLTGKEIHIATVVGENVDPLAQEAMLAVMNTFFKDKNARTRYEKKRVDRGPFYQHYRLKAYRSWVLHVWKLQGASETWEAQLEDYYEKQPVFAMLGGMVQGAWGPIHNFCEKNEIPSLLPNTDRPGGIGTDDFYTLYFSEGLGLDARVIAADLAEQKEISRALQVYRPEQKGAFGASSFRETSGQLKGVTVFDWVLKEGTHFDRIGLLNKVKETGAETVILWLPPEELEGVDLEGMEQVLTGYIYLSSSMTKGIFASVQQKIGKRVKLVHPFVLSENQESVFKRVGGWLKGKKIPIQNHRILGQTYYACMMLKEGLMHIKRHFYRDYLMDALDHGNAKSIFAVNYPRLSYGPGQRYLAKGAFIVENPASKKEKPSASAIWTVPHL